MNLNDYQTLALRSESQESRRPKHFTETDARLLNGVLGIAGEGGELADFFKKVIFHGHPYDDEKMIKELGDVLWYCAQTAAALGVTLEEVAERNVIKLKNRYPERFLSDLSLNKDESKE